MDDGLPRRRFFKAMGLAGAFAAAPGRLLAGSQPTQQERQGDHGSDAGSAEQGAAEPYQFFTEPEAEFVTAAVDRLIPADDEWPSASQAGVVRFLDLQLSGAYGAGSRLYRDGPWQLGAPQQGYQLPLTPAELYRISIAAIEARIKDAYEGQAFADLSEAEQDEILEALESEQFQLEELPAAVFFETLLANTIEGFFSDPVYGGNRDMAGWRMVGFPGAYAQYMFDVDQHGKRFDRPPISIAQIGSRSGTHG